MDTSINNAKAFTDAIKKMAAEECDRINNETNTIKAERLKSFNEEAESHYADYVNYEMKRIVSEKNREISTLEEESRRKLSALRKELTDKVFAKVEEDIKAFTKTEEYKDLLVSLVEQICDSMPNEELEFFVRAEDIEHKEDINEKLGKYIHISVSDSIRLGGIKAVNRRTGCLLDNTLDLKSEEQKTWFLENSGLKI